MTPRLALLVGVRGTHDEDVDPDSEFTPRSYATGDVGMQWRWEEEFSLRPPSTTPGRNSRTPPTDPALERRPLSVLYQPVQRRR